MPFTTRTTILVIRTMPCTLLGTIPTRHIRPSLTRVIRIRRTALFIPTTTTTARRSTRTTATVSIHPPAPTLPSITTIMATPDSHRPLRLSIPTPLWMPAGELPFSKTSLSVRPLPNWEETDPIPALASVSPLALEIKRFLFKFKFQRKTKLRQND
jgi:hypothetical protein